MAYPVRPRQSARIVTTNAEESAEAEVADHGVGQGEGPNCALSHKTICVRGNFCSQMSEEELSFQDDRAYPDNREEATMSIMRSYNEIRFGAKPPYAERHVRWCERNGNFRFPTYSIYKKLCDGDLYGSECFVISD